jgi:flagellum-specific peptidoglycan hydrolase FlgJ
MNRNEILGYGAGAIIIILWFTRKPIIKTIKKLMNRSEFIETFAPVVKHVAKGTNLFPSLFMAQAILESSDSKGIPGNSGLAKNHNNFFGIKVSKDWKGRKIIMKTREVLNGKSVMVDAPFRKYDTPEQSFSDRVKFLQDNKRYAKAGVFTAKTPYAQAEAFQKAGYATDPDYAKILQGLINKYSLYTLDDHTG